MKNMFAWSKQIKVLVTLKYTAGCHGALTFKHSPKLCHREEGKRRVIAQLHGVSQLLLVRVIFMNRVKHYTDKTLPHRSYHHQRCLNSQHNSHTHDWRSPPATELERVCGQGILGISEVWV